MKRKSIIILAVLGVLIIGAVFGIFKYYSIQNDLKKLANTQISDVDLSQKPDGIYKGSYKIFPIEVIVNVTVADHRIKKIDLIRHVNGQGQAAEAIPEMVVRAQSLQVDAVSGATYSSKAILKAIENAFTAM